MTWATWASSLSLSLLFLYFCSDLRLTFYCTCMIRDILRLKCNNIHLRLLVVPIPSSSSTCHPFAVRKTHVSSRPKPRPTSAGSWDTWLCYDYVSSAADSAIANAELEWVFRFMGWWPAPALALEPQCQCNTFSVQHANRLVCVKENAA